MGTDKPLISILMAVYEPQMDWLRVQLDSLNAQTYPNLRLYIRDDCSPNVPFEGIKTLAAECITAFPFTIERNERNLGSNSTFERLTSEAEGEYFAYCDQDDEWLAFYRRYAAPSPALSAFVSARLAGKSGPVFRYRTLSPMDAKFELAMKLLPEPLFRTVVRRISH